MELSKLRVFEKRHVQSGILSVEVLFRQDASMITRPGYFTRIDDSEPMEETDYDRQLREDIEAVNRSKPIEYRDEPSVKPPYLDFHKYLEGHNGMPEGDFPIPTDDIVGIRRLVSYFEPDRKSEYTLSKVVQLRCENRTLPMGSEIRAGYLENIDEIVRAWEKDSKPSHIILYTHLKDGMMQSPLPMESKLITNLKRLFIGESMGFS
jgi:hypothetical protein